MASGYGHVSADQVGGNNASRNKRMATIGVSSLILVAMVVAVAVGVSNNHGKAKEGTADVPNTSTKAVEAICQPTDYKEACKESLSAAGSTSDPKELVQIAFNATMKKLAEAASHSTTLQELEKDPSTHQALEDCKEVMNAAVSDLERSFETLGALDISKIDDILQDLTVWLSASITYQETCLDGFENTTGDAGMKMKEALNKTREFTSNALAMIDGISGILTSLDIPFLNRRLLSEESEDGIPSWVDTERRGLLAEPSRGGFTPNVVVAQDGSGKYTTINEALKEVPLKGKTPFIIYIKEGIYKEYVTIQKGMNHLVLIGDGPTKTKITGNKNFVDGTKTFHTCTVAVMGEHFMARDLGIENSSGPEKHQAVALRVQSDMSIFYNCQFDGYQDTLYTHTYRQFYRDCTISGTIDFVFGDAAVVLQNCKFVVRKPMDNQQCAVTAQGRTDKRQPTGIVIQDSIITSDPEYFPFRTTLKSYLGRPWKNFSRTIIMNTQIDDLIAPEGWTQMQGTFGIDTCFYAEIGNKGPGAVMTGRVKWKGVKTLDAAHATSYAPKRFIKGDSWIIPSGVPYDSGITAA